MSATRFALQIDRELADKKEYVELIVRRVALEGLLRIVNRSPVDTGRFRGNWSVSLGARDMTSTQEIDPGGGRTITEGATRLAAYDLDTPAIYIQNNLPYSEVLEDGSSKQAPAGVLAVTVAELNAMFAGVRL